MFDSFAVWLSPASLFLLLNVVIGTIWITSLSAARRHHTKRYYSPPINHHSNTADGYFPPAEQVYANITEQHAPVTRAPSLLDRVKSVTFNDFQFSFFGSDFHNPEPQFPRPVEPDHVPAPDSNPVQYPKPGCPDLTRPPLARAPSLLERVKSITFTDLHRLSVFRSESPIRQPEIAVADPVPDRDGGEENKKSMEAPAAEKMKKSASEKRGVWERRRPATARVERTVTIGVDVEVDAKADDFINRFKQQLKLQRLDSILQYKEMITRGASK